MAVIKKVAVTVVSGGEELREYRPPTENAFADQEGSSRDTQVRYIQGIADANFGIKCQIKKTFQFKSANFVAFQVTIDGERVRGPACTIETYRTLGVANKFVIYFVGPVSPRSTSPAGKKKGKYQNLGTIKVEVWRKQGGKTSEKLGVWREHNQEPVPEKAIKGEAIDLRASLDVTTCVKKARTLHGIKVGDKPYAIFVFKYRSKEALESLGILERPQTPQPLEERDVETLSPEELKELARRLKAAQDAHRINIKRENANTNLAQLAELKRGPKDTNEDDDQIEFLGEQPVKRIRTIGPAIDDSD